MKLEGQFRVPASLEIVYSKLLDPAVLAAALPGCERCEPDGEGRFRARMRIGIAAVKGTYDGEVEILDQHPPERLRMKIEGKGPGSFIKGEGTLTFAADSGQTLVNYSGDAQIGGVLASVGQRMMQAATKQIVGQFFQAFAKQIQTT
jgi:uncharacterized protein